MAKQTFTLWDHVVLDNTTVSGNGTFHLATSASQANTVGLKSLKLVIKYDGIVPDFGANPQTFDIDAVVEGKIGNEWFPVAYQFTTFRRTTHGTQRILQLQPSLAGFDAGVDDIMYVGDSTVARISRQQGNLPDTEYRVCILVTERDYGGPGSFQSVTLTSFGEAFDAA